MTPTLSFACALTPALSLSLSLSVHCAACALPTRCRIACT